LGRLAKARHGKANEARSGELKATALYFQKKVTKEGDQDDRQLIIHSVG